MRHRKSWASSSLEGALNDGDREALRVDVGQHAANRAVLAGGVHALEHEQHGAAVLGVQPVGQVADRRGVFASSASPASLSTSPKTWRGSKSSSFTSECGGGVRGCFMARVRSCVEGAMSIADFGAIRIKGCERPCKNKAPAPCPALRDERAMPIGWA